jgi:hypothetical protein
MKVTLVNQTDQISASELATMVKAVQSFADLATKAWQKSPLQVSSASLRVDKTWNVYLSGNKAMAGAYGYHVVENGLPAAYISPTTCRLTAKESASHDDNLWGVVRKHPAITTTSKGVVMGGKVIVKPKTRTTPGRPTFYIPGMVAVICHELAEMIADPAIDNWATIPVGTKDFPNGATVLVEIGDHTPGHFDVTFGTQDVVFPDFTLPSFYDAKGKAPYSYIGGIITAPFQFVHRAYAFIRDSTGARMKNFAESGDDRV